MGRAHFTVAGRFDMASLVQDGRITIDRGAALFTVRPKGRRQVYTLPLDAVAEMAVARFPTTNEMPAPGGGRARFQVNGKLNGKRRPATSGTLLIDRGAGLFIVRARARRKIIVAPLDRVATMVVQRLIKAAVFKKRLERAARRKARRG